MTRDSAEHPRSRAGGGHPRGRRACKRFPDIYSRIRHIINTRLVFLEADDETIVRRFSETRRPHPLGKDNTITKSIRAERKQLAPIRAMADLIVNTSKFTVHELRDFIGESFGGEREESKIMIYVTSFGYRHGVPADSDLVFDVRFLPNPNYIPRFKHLTGTQSQRGAIYPVFPADGGVRRAHFGAAGLPAAALHPRGQELSDHCVWMHRRASPVGHDRRPDPQKPGTAGYKAKATHRDMAKPV